MEIFVGGGKHTELYIINQIKVVGNVRNYYNKPDQDGVDLVGSLFFFPFRLWHVFELSNLFYVISGGSWSDSFFLVLHALSLRQEQEEKNRAVVKENAMIAQQIMNMKKDPAPSRGLFLW